MKEIVISRKNDFMNNILNLDVYVNNVKNTLPSNSKLTFNLEESKIIVKVKYLWLSSGEIELNTDEKKIKIEVLPIFSNRLIILFTITLIVLFFLTNLFDNKLLDFSFRFIYWSFFGVFLFFLTIGRNNYFRVNITN